MSKAREQLIESLTMLAGISGQMRVKVFIFGQGAGKRDADLLDQLETKMIEVEMMIARFAR